MAGDQTMSDMAGTSGVARERKIWRSYWPDGQPQQVDATELDGDQNKGQHTYQYFWLPTGQLSEIDGPYNGANGSNGQSVQLCYDTAGRPTAVDQYIAQQATTSSPQFDTLFSYDADGNVTYRSDNGDIDQQNAVDSFQCPNITQNEALPLGAYQSGQTTTFGYDNLDRQTSMTVQSNSGATPQEPVRAYYTSYWPSGQVQMQARQQAPSDSQNLPSPPSSMSCPGQGSPSGGLIEECRYYNDNGQLAEQARSSDNTDQTYTYDADGNRTEDERGTETYNALDQEVQWVRGGTNTQGSGGTVTYTHDGDGGLLQETDNVEYPSISTTITGIPVSEDATVHTTVRYCSEQSASTATGQTPDQAADASMCSQGRRLSSRVKLVGRSSAGWGS